MDKREVNPLQDEKVGNMLVVVDSASNISTAKLSQPNKSHHVYLTVKTIKQ